MAGKTLPGVGKGGGEDKSGGKDPKPAPAASTPAPIAAPATPDRSGPYSGPTVVDDDKVAEGLRRLRSLDDPLGSLAGVTRSVTDTSSADVTRVGSPSASREGIS